MGDDGQNLSREEVYKGKEKKVLYGVLCDNSKLYSRQIVYIYIYLYLSVA